MTRRGSAEPSYSNRVLQPFLTLLERQFDIPRELLDAAGGRDPDQRIPVSRALEQLELAIALTGDPELGLRAARESSQGDYDLLEYLASSADTGVQAVEAICRYMPLVNDVAELTLERHGDNAVLRITSCVRLPRAAADFQSAALYAAMTRWQPPNPKFPVEVWFMHARPADTSEYMRVFCPARIRFGAPFDGYVFDHRWMEQPLPSADPKLHRLLCRHADERLAALPRTRVVLRRVRELVAEELCGGNPSADHIAARLRVSRRTLTRWLDREGTTFKALLDQLRRDLATRSLITESIGIAELGHRLGFCEPAAFSRAFKRWTGKTPGRYRRDHAQSARHVLE